MRGRNRRRGQGMRTGGRIQASGVSGGLLQSRSGNGVSCTVAGFVASVRTEACKGCKECASVCPGGAISFDSEKKAVVDPASCFGCGVCARVCPTGAVEMIPRAGGDGNLRGSE